MTNPFVLADTRRVLRKARFDAHQFVSAEVAETIGLETMLGMAADDLVVKFTAHVLGDRVLEREQQQTVRFPSNPWQHFKARFGPAWFRRRWPVRYAETTVTVRVEVDAMYPRARVLMGDRLGPVVFHETGSAWWADVPGVARVEVSPLTYGQVRAGNRSASEGREW